MPKPDWWPRNPYPEDVFPMTCEGVAKAIPDDRLRTAIAGCLGHLFFDIASEMIYAAYCQQKGDAVAFEHSEKQKGEEHGNAIRV